MSARTGTENATSAKEPAEAPSVFVHGGRVLPSVTVDTYNEELRDDEGFVGDRASRRAFHAILADWRDRLKERGEDPFGDIPMEEISKSKLDKMLNAGDPVSAGLVHTVVEEFAGELATVIRRFLRLDTWKDTQRIVIGGGMIGSRIGELAMGFAQREGLERLVAEEYAPGSFSRRDLQQDYDAYLAQAEAQGRLELDAARHAPQITPGGGVA